MQVGLSQPFAEWLLPRIKAHFPDFPERSAVELYQAENVMKTPSLIRVEADEVRGSICHVIVMSCHVMCVGL
jgi:Zn-dependent M32 family carboxypeptidase